MQSKTIAVQNHKIGANVSVSESEVPRGIKITEQKSIDLPLKEAKSLGPVVRISPDGILSSPIKLHFSLNKHVKDDFTTVIATKKTDESEWEFMTPVISEDGQTATIETRHFSIWVPILLMTNPYRTSSEFKRKFIDNLTGEYTEKAKKPVCQNEKEARMDNYSINSSTSDTLYWCFGVEKGKRILKVVNRKRYPLDLEHPGLQVIKLPPVLAEFKQIARFASGIHTLLFPHDEVTYAVEVTEPDTSAVLRSSFSLTSGQAVTLGGVGRRNRDTYKYCTKIGSRKRAYQNAKI